MQLIIGRRQFLRTSSLAASAFASHHMFGSETQSVKAEPDSSHIPTRDTRMKFSPDGAALPFRGNTVICHLQPQGTLRDAVNAIQPDLAAATFASKIALLPAVSYHMTVFPGANDQGRELTGWPSNLSKDASIERCDQFIGERMQRFRLQCELPLRMKLDSAKTLANQRATTLRMMGMNAEEESKIRKLRDRLVESFGFRDRNHDDYGFHITLAYQLQPFTPREQQEHNQILAKHVPMIEAAAPSVDFGNPEYCTFSDMFRYDIHSLLAT